VSGQIGFVRVRRAELLVFLFIIAWFIAVAVYLAQFLKWPANAA